MLTYVLRNKEFKALSIHLLHLNVSEVRCVNLGCGAIMHIDLWGVGASLGLLLLSFHYFDELYI